MAPRGDEAGGRLDYPDCEEMRKKMALNALTPQSGARLLKQNLPYSLCVLYSVAFLNKFENPIP